MQFSSLNCSSTEFLLASLIIGAFTSFLPVALDNYLFTNQVLS